MEKEYKLLGLIKCESAQCIEILSYIVIALIVFALLLTGLVLFICCWSRKNTKKVQEQISKKADEAAVQEQMKKKADVSAIPKPESVVIKLDPVPPKPAPVEPKPESSSSSSSEDEFVRPMVFTVNNTWQTNEMEMNRYKSKSKKRTKKSRSNKVDPEKSTKA